MKKYKWTVLFSNGLSKSGESCADCIAELLYDVVGPLQTEKIQIQEI